MIIGERLRELREANHLSQGDIEKRTGLLRCYISRVENGHTVPAIETLEKIARALELPLYYFMYDGDEVPEAPTAIARNGNKSQTWGLSGKDARYFQKLRRLLAKMNSDDRKLLLHTVQKLARRGKD
jgi:transcriptional regulator with XRE-family HTH domain